MAGKEYSISRESLRQCEANIYAKENRQCISTPAFFFHERGWIAQAALMIRNPGCGSQRLLLCRSHPAGRGPSLASLFPPQAAVGSAVVRIHPPL